MRSCGKPVFSNAVPFSDWLLNIFFKILFVVLHGCRQTVEVLFHLCQQREF